MPENAVSGVYLASSSATTTARTNQIPFIVRNDDAARRARATSSCRPRTRPGTPTTAGPATTARSAAISTAIRAADRPPPTIPARQRTDRAYAVSYNRPFITRDGSGPASGAQDYLFGADYAAIYWLEKHGYDVSYISGVDTDRLGPSYLLGHKAFISVGHDEYWSGEQRDNVEEARDAGVNLLFWSGNEVYWKTRCERASPDRAPPYRTLVCYKETWANCSPTRGPEDYANIDPSNDWTGTWRDTALRRRASMRRATSSPRGARPGELAHRPALRARWHRQFGGALDVPAALAGPAGLARHHRRRRWRELDIAPGILGYEWDTSPEDAYRPAGLIKLSETTIPLERHPGRSGQPDAARRRDAQSYALPRRQRRAGLRRRDGVLELGAQRPARQLALRRATSPTPPSSSSRSTCSPTWASSPPCPTRSWPAGVSCGRAPRPTTRRRATTMRTSPSTAPALSPITITGTATDNDGNAVDGRTAWWRGRGLGRRRRDLEGGERQGKLDVFLAADDGGDLRVMARAIDDSLNLPASAVSPGTPSW